MNNVAELRALGIQFFPNPTVDQLRIEGPAKQVQLMDLNGRMLQQVVPADEHHTLHLGNYPAGTYLLRITHDKGISTAKVIKK